MRTLLIAGILCLAATGVTAQENLASAIKLTEGEQFDAAKAIFDKLIVAEPTNGDNYFYLGENYLAQYFADTITVSISDVEAPAKNAFLKGVEVDPENPLCYIGLAKIALLTQDTSAARWLNSAFSTFPSKTNKTSTLAPEKQALALAKAAEAMIQAKINAYTKALELVTKAAELDPKNPEIFLIWGDVYMVNNEGSNAKAKYNIAQDLNPNSPAAKLRVGKLWVRARNWNDAISSYNEAIAIDPNFAPAYVELGTIYSMDNQPAKAKEYFEKYNELSSSLAASIKYLAILLKLELYEEAIPVALDILKVAPERYDMHRALAICYYETKKYPDALEEIKTFFSSAPVEKIQVNDYNYYGDILMKNKQYAESIDQYKKVMELDPERWDVCSKIADAYNLLKDKDQAIAWYEKKNAAGKMNLADYYKLGIIYYNVAASSPSDTAWMKADTTFAAITNSDSPTFQSGKAFLWRGRCKSQLDLDLSKQLANPYYEKFIEIAKSDSVKNCAELAEAYDYFQYFYVKNKDYCTAKLYVERILWTDTNGKYADIPKFTDLLADYTKNCPK